MKAMILAAGKGERLRPLTDTVPKPMIPVSEKPILEHVVRLLVGHGFDQIAINLHHMPETIRNHFGDGSGLGARVIYSDEEDLCGTAGAVKRIADFFDEPFLVYYGDNLSNVDLTDFWSAHAARQQEATIGLAYMDDPTSRGIVELDADSQITRFIEKPSIEEVFEDYHVNAGVYALEPQILDRIPNGVVDFARDVFPEMLASDAGIYGHRLVGQVLSTDTPERYDDTCQRVASGDFRLP
jgi:NDP-sugar pyrophosphorylase family protein